MKRIVLVISLALFALPVASMGQQRKIEGKGEEYHHAMYLNFKHAAEEAEALYVQLGLPHELNLEIARAHVNEIWMNLDNARIQHAMIHKSYGDQQATLIAENHDVILEAHNNAFNAAKLMKKEIESDHPDKKILLEQSAEVYRQASKAAAEHMDGMKKLGISPMRVSS